jgi:hypothetical protein
VFDGVDDYAQLPSINTFTGSYTIGVWAKPPNSTYTLFSAGNLVIQLFGGSSDNYRSVSFISPTGSVSTPGLNDDWRDSTWNYFTVTFDLNSGISAIYVNGSQLASGSFTTTINSSPNVKIIPTGSIATFTLHNKALSSTEVAQVYTGQKKRFGL